MTGLLGIVIMYIYSMFGFYSQTLHSTMIAAFNTAGYEVPLCVDPLNCFMMMLNMGLRAGGGIGDILA